MKVNNETKIGALTAISITVLILGYNYLKGKEVFTHTKDFYTVYQHTDGLKVSNPILMKGVQIGRVSDMTLRDDGSIYVKLTIRNEVRIPQSTIATLISADILGAKAIDFKYATNTGELADEAEIPGEIAPGFTDQLAPFQSQAASIMSKLDTLSGKLNTTFDAKFIADLQKSMSAMRVTLDNAAIASAKFDAIMQSVESISSNLQKNNEKINAILSNAKNLSDTLAKAELAATVRKANAALAQVTLITEKINKGEGTLGQLVNDKKLYDNLTATSADLDKLFIDLKANPKRYVHFSVFGNKKTQ